MRSFFSLEDIKMVGEEGGVKTFLINSSDKRQVGGIVNVYHVTRGPENLDIKDPSSLGEIQQAPEIRLIPFSLPPGSISTGSSCTISFQDILKMNIYVTLIVVATILVARGAVGSADPITEVNCDTMIVQLRELYRILMSNGGIPGFHAMVRKAQRVPSLRLRFGKRFSPAWDEPRPTTDIEKNQLTE
ncbi:uncharacterized protein NPIL_388511 [Nephila pilipes]|uniref:Uncharacterized protein n=1 Tax=Nephila pilipes TaxID=299642 RepID=A0A8X6QII2_NEPPI|nr:uncharacterized protein NPIL_388511 [Nephila pilipes]